MTSRSLSWFAVPLVGGLLATLTSLVVAHPALWQEDAKPSQYAPAKDARAQVDYYLKELARDLSDPEEYGEEQQERIRQHANTLATLALVLGKHDQENDLRGAAPGLIAACGDLAIAVDSYEEAKAALAQVEKAMSSKGDASRLKWEPVAELPELMKQVPIVNNRLRGGIDTTDRRFKRAVDKTAGYAATLAALAQASMHDTEYCGDESDVMIWKRICADLRDGSAEAQRAARKGDQEMARQAIAKIAKTCDACHEVFR